MNSRSSAPVAFQAVPKRSSWAALCSFFGRVLRWSRSAFSTALAYGEVSRVDCGPLLDGSCEPVGPQVLGAEAEHALSSAPVEALLGARSLLTDIERNGLTDAQEISRRLSRVRPSPLSPLRWVLGVQLVIEWLFPKLHLALASRVDAVRLKALQLKKEAVASRIDAHLGRGGAAEAVVSTYIEDVRSAAGTGILTWRPADQGVQSIVMPPSLRCDSSHELDDVFITCAGVYLLEVKGWRDVRPNGGHQAQDGTELDPAHHQSIAKVRRLRDLFGPDVPVHSLVMLPNVAPAQLPWDLGATYLTGPADLSLTFRAHFHARRLAGLPMLDPLCLGSQLMPELDGRPQAKLHHLLWLAERYPGDGRTQVKELFDQLLDLERQAGVRLPLVVRPRRHLVIAIAALFPVATAAYAAMWVRQLLG